MRALRIVLALVFSVGLVAQIALSVATPLLPRLGYQVLVITGGSMEPTYNLGSALVLKDVAPDDVKVGLPVTFTSVERVLTTHRVIDVRTIKGIDYVRTQGDANADPDPNMAAVSAVVGTPVAHMPYGGYIASFLLSSLGRLFVFGPPLAYLLFGEVRRALAVVRTPTTPAPALPVTVQPEPTRDRAPRRRRARLVSLPVMPVVVAVLIASALTGAYTAQSLAMFTASASSQNSSAATVTVAPPTNLSGFRYGRSNILIWTDSKTAQVTEYDVYRKTGKAAPVLIDTVTSTYIADQNGTPSSIYTVVAVAGSWTSVPAGPITTD